MKQIILASAAILLAVISTQANDAITNRDTKPSKEERKEIRKDKRHEKMEMRQSTNKEVNYQSKEEFYRKFGDKPDVTWSRTNNYDEAIFNNEGLLTTAYFDAEANMVGTTSIKKFTDLPAAGQKAISKEYRDYQVKQVIYFDDNESVDTDILLYGNLFDGGDNYFVELQKDDKSIIVQVRMDGLTSYYSEL